MKTLKFKTNIKCGSCIIKVTPALDQLAPEKWNVDTANPAKILSIETDNADEVVSKLKEVGYSAQLLAE
ncbi:MAG TPA: hypothetical protein DCQ31_02300 [Bacteroidales bacterium]|nr:hypothetical protein [Bacteroidales bacterium]